MILVAKNKLFLLSYTLLFFFLLLTSCSKSDIAISGPTMGTTYSIKINNNKYIQDNYLKKKIEDKLFYLNSVFSTYDINSELSNINFSDQSKFIVSNELGFIISKSLYYSNLSEGLYDPTVYPLVDLWGFGPTFRNSIPDIVEINQLLRSVSYKNISIKNNELFIYNNDTFIDLSSIAKGYVVDQISELLINEGFENFMVEIGGEVRCKGKNYNNDWVIGIINPLSEYELIKTKISDLSIATSGNYNNYTIYNGVKYSHILNPRTGFPVDNKVLSASVISESCTDSDVIATILMVMPYNDGIKLINSLDNVECLLFVNENGNERIIKSKGFDDFIN